MTTFFRRLSTAAAVATAFIAAALTPTPAIAQNVTPVKNGWLYGTGSLSQSVASGVTTSGTLGVTTGGFLILNTGGTLSLSSGTITGSPGIIPASLISGSIGTVTGMTLTLGGALTGSLTNTASVPALTLTLSTFPSASLSGTITNGQLANSSITVGGTSISLGGSASTLTSLTLSSLTVSGLSTAGFVVNNAAGLLSTTTSIVPASISGTLYTLSIASAGSIAVTPASTVTLAAGSNVTLSLSGNTVTVNSTAGGGGTVTQVTGTTGRVTVTSTTSTPVVTLPTTLSLSDTTGYFNVLLPTSSQSNIAASVAGYAYPLLIGTLSYADPFGYTGSIASAGVNSAGLSNYLFAAPTSNVEVLGTFSTALANLVNYGSNSAMVVLGDSVGYYTAYYLGNRLQQTYGYAGTNGGTNVGGISGYGGAASLSGTAALTSTTSGTFTYSPDGVWVTLSTSDAVTFPSNAGSTAQPGWMADRITFKVPLEPGLGNYTLQTSSNGTSFSNVTGTVSYTTDGITWTSTNANVIVNASASASAGIRLIRVPLTTTTYSYGRVVANTGSIITLLPDFDLTTNSSGFAIYRLDKASISLASQASVPASRALVMFRAWNPSVVTMQYVDGAQDTGTGLASISTTLGNWNYVAIGGPPIGNGTTATVGAGSMELQNAHYAAWAAATGNRYFDGFTVAGSYSNALAQMPGYDVHPFDQYNRLSASKLSNELHAFDTPLTPFYATSLLTPTAVIGATGLYFVDRSQTGPGGGRTWLPTTSQNLLRFVAASNSFTISYGGGATTSTFSIYDSVGGSRFYVTSSGSAAFGVFGSQVIINSPTQVGYLQNITIDQPNKKITITAGNTSSGAEWIGPANDGSNRYFTTLRTGSYSQGNVNYLKFQTYSTSNVENTPLTLWPNLAEFSVSLSSPTISVTSLSVGSPLTMNVGPTDSSFRISRVGNDGANGSYTEINSGSVSSATTNYFLIKTVSSSGGVVTNIGITPLTITFGVPIGSMSVSGTLSVSGVTYHGGASSFASTLSASGATTLGSTLVVGGLTTLNSGTDATNSTSGALVLVGGAGIQKSLFVGGGVVSTSVSATNITASSTLGLGSNGAIDYNAANGQFRFSSFGGHAVLTDYSGNTGLAISSPIFTMPPNGSPSLTATAASTTWGASINFNTHSYTAVIGAGGPTQGNGGDGTVLANRFYLGATANTISMTINSTSGTITMEKAFTASSTLAVTGLTTLNSGTLAGTQSLTGSLVGGGSLFTASSSGVTPTTVTAGGTLNIQAGSNITITGAAGTLTISGSAGGSGGYSTASASSGLVASSVSATTVSYGSYIFHGITSSASPALNTSTLSLAAGSTFTTSGSSVQISSSNSASVLTVSGSPTLSGSGTITYSALPFLAANQTFSGANTFSGTTTLSTLSGTVSLAGQFDGTNGIRMQSTGSTANVLTLKSASQSAARTLTLSIDSSATVSVASLLYTNQSQNATLGTVTASTFSAGINSLSFYGATITNALNIYGSSGQTNINNNTKIFGSFEATSDITGLNVSAQSQLNGASLSISGPTIYSPNLQFGGGSGDVVYFDTGTGQITHDSAPSDPRTKDKIEPLGLGLAELRKLADAQGDIAFNYKPGFNSQPDLRRGGFNARVLADVSPLLAHDRGTLNGVEHVLEPEERAVQAMTVRAVAELSAQVSELLVVVYALITIIFIYAFIFLSTIKNRR